MNRDPHDPGGLRLSFPALLNALGLFAVAAVVLPLWWAAAFPARLETLADYRPPYARSEDYWLADRLAAAAAGRGSLVLLGDSVVWGAFVHPDQTWSAAINRRLGGQRVLNLGLNGMHPAALQGLIDSCLPSLRRADVLLHCNPLWLSSPQRDLSQADDESPVNHPQLLPQWRDTPPSYQADWEQRLGAVVDRNVPLRRWSRHLRAAYFDGQPPHRWWLEHPYQTRDPSGRSIPQVESQSLHAPRSWIEARIPPLDAPWVPLQQSYQWRSFRRAIQQLQARENRVRVLLGPLNVHLLTPASRQRYEALIAQLQAELEKQDVPVLRLEPLASELYADASHPLAAGYEQLAEQCVAQLQWTNAPPSKPQNHRGKP